VSKTKVKATDTVRFQRMIKAVGHPLRMRILALLNQKVASPNELATELGEPLGSVAYHVRILLDLETIELVRETPRRGAIEHHYRALVRPWFRPGDWGQLPVSARNAVAGGVLEQVWADVSTSLESDVFEIRTDRHLSRTPLVLDEQGWTEAMTLLDDTLERLVELQAEAAGRMAADGAGESITAEAVLIGFETASPAADA
jgi:DNA-binding transcriptional ArsR family regulator